MYERQALLIPEPMQRSYAVVVGLGMLGSWVVNSLSRTMRGVLGFDFDTVGRENLGTQAYDRSDVGLAKALALTKHLNGAPYEGYDQRFDGSDSLPYLSTAPHIFISAVDSFAGRAMVAQAALDAGASLFIDTRAQGTVGIVVTVKPSDIPLYLSSLESDENTPPPECGAEGTAFVGLWVASQVTSSIVRVCRGLPVPFKVVHDVGMDARIYTAASAQEDAELERIIVGAPVS